MKPNPAFEATCAKPAQAPQLHVKAEKIPIHNTDAWRLFAIFQSFEQGETTVSSGHGAATSKLIIYPITNLNLHVTEYRSSRSNNLILHKTALMLF